ncbi:MAG: DegV family protein [Candidatus Heimdallarchaeota archaeon]
MTKIALFTDTASDINQYPELKDQVKVDGIIHTYINIGEESFTEKDMDQEELLKRMDTDDTAMWPKTSQPSVGDFVEHYEKLKSEGFTDVISVPVAEGLSGTLNSARLASQEVEGLNVYLVDSQLASLGIIPTLVKVRGMMDQGMAPEEIQSIANEWALDNKAFAAVPTLDNLYKGGRLKPLRYRLGKFLNFKPILLMSNGAIVSHDKTRDLAATQDKTYEYALENLTSDDDFEFIIAHAWSEENAKKYEAKFKEDFPGKKYYVGRAGTTISVHLGPGGVAFSVIRKN